MKRILPLALLVIIVNTVLINAQTQALISFKKVIAKVDANFKKTPSILASQEYESSTTGKIYYKYKIDIIESSYDVQKTNSIVTPYIGYLILTIHVSSNEKNGDVEGFHEKVGFSNLEEAINNNNFLSCTMNSYNENDWCTGEIKVNYAHQNNKWIYKNVETELSNKIKDGKPRFDIERGVLDSMLKCIKL